MKKGTKENFEDALKQLEIIVKKMEVGDMTLEESLTAFEEGIRLARFCSQKLANAQRRVEQLVDKDGLLENIPWQETAGDE